MKIVILGLVLGITVVGFYFFTTNLAQLNKLSATEGFLLIYKERIHRFSTVNINEIIGSKEIQQIPNQVTAALEAKDFELARKYLKEIQNEVELHKKNGTWTGDNRTRGYAVEALLELDAYIEISLKVEEELKDRNLIFRTLYFFDYLINKTNK